MYLMGEATSSDNLWSCVVVAPISTECPAHIKSIIIGHHEDDDDNNDDDDSD